MYTIGSVAVNFPDIAGCAPGYPAEYSMQGATRVVFGCNDGLQFPEGLLIPGDMGFKSLASDHVFCIATRACHSNQGFVAK